MTHIFSDGSKALHVLPAKAADRQGLLFPSERCYNTRQSYFSEKGVAPCFPTEICESC